MFSISIFHFIPNPFFKSPLFRSTRRRDTPDESTSSNNTVNQFPTEGPIYLSLATNSIYPKSWHLILLRLDRLLNADGRSIFNRKQIKPGLCFLPLVGVKREIIQRGPPPLFVPAGGRNAGLLAAGMEEVRGISAATHMGIGNVRRSRGIIRTPPSQG